MSIENLLSIENEEQAICLQESLKTYISKDEEVDRSKIKIVAGVDLAYWGREGKEYAVCCISVSDFDTKQLIESVDLMGEIQFPYIPGCLTFRELPLIMETIKKLTVRPDLYVFDGNGYLHPRHMGIATHAGLYLEQPTIGVAKSYYKVGDVDFDTPENEAGAYTDILVNEEVYGRVLRTHKDVKPVFLSIGNRIDLETATELVGEMVTKESHIPAPTRLADIATHKMRSYYKQQG